MRSEDRIGIKLIAIVIVLSLTFVMLLTGCNKQIVDLNYTFNYGIIQLPNGEIVEGKVQSWKDFEDGDQLQVKINDVMYLVHSTDVVLMTKEK